MTMYMLSRLFFYISGWLCTHIAAVYDDIDSRFQYNLKLQFPNFYVLNELVIWIQSTKWAYYEHTIVHTTDNYKHKHRFAL